TEGQLDGLYLAMLVMISLAVFENVAPMAVFPAHFEENRKAAARLDQVVSEPVQAAGDAELPLNALDIKLENVSYTYPEEERRAIEGVSIRLAPGSKTAIVGPSGSGKSTLLQLLLNILPADSGTISIGGEPL